MKRSLIITGILMFAPVALAQVEGSINADVSAEARVNATVNPSAGTPVRVIEQEVRGDVRKAEEAKRDEIKNIRIGPFNHTFFFFFFLFAGGGVKTPEKRKKKKKE